ncbi:hypothetical protein GCM10010116_16280 [Microbispora rosea subsp. aerata]|nr:HPF/RaiA family ribosome-associated protein [Microbispora rosea]GGO08058.1 hypothetical protein GCM10010116_16280 [Microbispora rosea subsp. aerata]GIH53326.1 hypothetical protein Mro02_02400 [Microbispora rosea subsp. aerata]GLJ83759.1 hypothetical protein GCM10017588_24870 [Microbispora rosea subsp. aerata]
MNTTFDAEAVVVETIGEVPPEAVAEARKRVAALARYTDRPILAARVTLHHSPGPAPDHRFAARAVLDVNGRPLHAHAEATNTYGAIAEVQDRLRTELARLRKRAR